MKKQSECGCAPTRASRTPSHAGTAFALVLTLALAACGGGDDGPVSASSNTPAPAPPTTPANAERSTAVSGRLLAPDGNTPIANALVYADGSTRPANAPTPAAPACGTAPTPTSPAACTDADGHFSFDAVLPDTGTQLVAVKGAFRLQRDISAPGNGALTLGAVRLPATPLGARVAVVTGSHDRWQDVLASVGYGALDAQGRLQLGSEGFDLFDGDSSLPSTYPSFDALFDDADGDGRADVERYALVFINSGASESRLGQSSRLDALRRYVQAGGRLVVSDKAYDFIEQAFPRLIDFEGDDRRDAEDAERMNAAQVGRDRFSTTAQLDGALGDWLAARPCAGGSCLNGTGTALLDSFDDDWAVMSGPHAGQAAAARVWARGPVSFRGQSTPVDRPLLVSFDVGAGRVSFSACRAPSGAGQLAAPLAVLRLLQFLVHES
jgi:hypothetical protein